MILNATNEKLHPFCKRMGECHRSYYGPMPACEGKCLKLAAVNKIPESNSIFAARSFSPEHRAKMLETLNWIALSIGVSVRIDNLDGLERVGCVGSAPSSAQLCYDGPNRVVICLQLNSYEDVEAALHELAHAKLGLDAEFKCYELEAVWALNFPTKVSLAVANMAHESGYHGGF